MFGASKDNVRDFAHQVDVIEKGIFHELLTFV